MPLPLNDDLATIFNVDEFAITVTYDGGAITGIFDNETIPVDAGGYTQVHQEQPRLLCRTSDVPSIAEGQTMIISAQTYVIRAWIHNGVGETSIQLEKS